MCNWSLYNLLIISFLSIYNKKINSVIKLSNCFAIVRFLLNKDFT